MSVAAFASKPLANGLPLRLYTLPTTRNPMKAPSFPNSTSSGFPILHWKQLVFLTKSSHNISTCSIKAFSSGADMTVRRSDFPGQFSFDAFLSLVEVLCIAPAVVLSVGGVMVSIVPGMPKAFQVNSGNTFIVWQIFLLVGAVVVGGLIRQRQWKRISEDNRAASGCNLIQRIEKVEEDLRSSVKIVRVLSRQLEKLGIRFRVTRKALKEPIAETAALTQKNSEATQALALQEEILEKELGEIQKVLLAMQEQQQKQLDLILAIAKAGRLFDNKHDDAPDGAIGKTNLISMKKELEQAETQSGRRKGATNDRS